MPSVLPVLQIHPAISSTYPPEHSTPAGKTQPHKFYHHLHQRFPIETETSTYTTHYYQHSSTILPSSNYYIPSLYVHHKSTLTSLLDPSVLHNLPSSTQPTYTYHPMLYMHPRSTPLSPPTLLPSSNYYMPSLYVHHKSTLTSLLDPSLLHDLPSCI